MPGEKSHIIHHINTIISNFLFKWDFSFEEMWWGERKTWMHFQLYFLNCIENRWKNRKRYVTCNYVFRYGKSNFERYKIHVPSDIKFAKYAVFLERFATNRFNDSIFTNIDPESLKRLLSEIPRDVSKWKRNPNTHTYRYIRATRYSSIGSREL